MKQRLCRDYIPYLNFFTCNFHFTDWEQHYRGNDVCVFIHRRCGVGKA